MISQNIDLLDCIIDPALVCRIKYISSTCISNDLLPNPYDFIRIMPQSFGKKRFTVDIGLLDIRYLFNIFKNHIC